MVLPLWQVVNTTQRVDIAWAQGTCAVYSTFITGDSFGATQANGIQTTLGQTNMITTCVDDDSADAATMQSTTDPYPADTVSLSTTLQGELRRLRYVLKKLTGWSQWYTHSEVFVFPNAGRFSSVGPFAFGGATSTLYQLGLLGTFDPSATAGAALSVGTTLTLASGEDAYGIRVAPTFTEFSSGVHALLAGIHVAPTITAGAATATTVAGISVATFAAATGTTNAAGVYISAAPTAATNNYALWVASGQSRLEDIILAASTTGPRIAGAATVLQLSGGTTAITFTSQSGVSELMRLTDGGILELGTTEGTAAQGGDMVFAAARGVRGVTAATTAPMIDINSGGTDYMVNIGGGYAGITPPNIQGLAAASFPAGSAGNNGRIGLDTTNNRFIFYIGSARYYVTGTSF